MMSSQKEPNEESHQRDEQPPKTLQPYTANSARKLAATLVEGSLPDGWLVAGILSSRCAASNASDNSCTKPMGDSGTEA